MRERTLRGQAAIVGIGETPYYRHGKSPDLEFVLTLKAILAACEDAGISPEEIDGFSSFSMDRSGPVRLAAARTKQKGLIDIVRDAVSKTRTHRR
jgi:cobalamin biosynthesis protein CbiG